jgi:hypothetical protein
MATQASTKALMTYYMSLLVVQTTSASKQILSLEARLVQRMSKHQQVLLVRQRMQ